MSFDPLAPSTESGTFDNDFEKLDSMNTNQEGVVSSSNQEDEDLYNPSMESSHGNEPLIDFKDETTAFSNNEPKEDDDKPEAAEIEPQMQTTTSISEQESESENVTECWVKKVDPRDSGEKQPRNMVMNLVLWRDPKKSGVVLGSALALLISLACFSVLSVFAYICLAALTVSLSFVVYKKIMGAVQKTNEGHPFKKLLEKDLSMSNEKVHATADAIADHLTRRINTLRRLFLVEDVVDTLKFGLVCWVLTYIGSWFNGMTLLILALIGVFTLPKVYEVYQEPIDKHVKVFTTRVQDVMAQIRSKIPSGKKKDE